MNTELLLQLAVLVGGCITTYAAIRSDLARLHERANQAVKSADLAHARIDQLMQGHK